MQGLCNREILGDLLKKSPQIFTGTIVISGSV